MGKTALDLTREEWQAYQPGTKVGQDQPRERWERAWRVASAAAEQLAKYRYPSRLHAG